MEKHNPPNNNKIVYFSHIRILAISLVIITHIFAFVFQSINTNNAIYCITLGFSSLLRIAVPLFFMVSGALHLNENKEFSAKKFYLHNLLRLVICFIFWDFIYANFTILLNYSFYNTSPTNYFSQLVKNMINYKYHLWFLIDLIKIYFIVPILRLFIKKENEIIIKNALIACFILICISSYFSIFEHKTIFSFLQYILPFEFINYLFYFILGWYLHNFSFSERENKLISILGIISIVLLPALNVLFGFLNAKNGIKFFLVENNFFVLNVFLAIFVFIMFKTKTKQHESKFTKVISANVFGIYLTHLFFNDLFFEIVKTELLLTPSLFIPLILLAFILIFICSFTLSFLIKKILGKLSRWVI